MTNSNTIIDAPLLIVDDNPRVRESLALSLSNRGFPAIVADTVDNGWEIIQQNKISLALIDVQLGSESGLDLLKRIKNDLGNPMPVILFTGYGTIEAAIDAIKMGAFNYLQKPIKTEQLIACISSALRLHFLEEENAILQKKIMGESSFVVIGKTLRNVCDKALKLAKTELPILIQGESGTGKEMITELIHKNSERKQHPLIKINCASFPENLIDDELFGHEKGAFTGAYEIFRGMFERADKGTLFLDELGDMPLSTQAKILRAIQNHEIKRIGSSQTMIVDVRFITATNKKLEKMLEEKTFREDLYYRLNTAILKLPPLRERRDEIIPLARHFLETIQNPNYPNYYLLESTTEILEKYSWPGNIRELKSTIEYAAAVSKSAQITLKDLPHRISDFKSNDIPTSRHQQMEKDLIINSLAICNNNKSKAAVHMGISRATLYNKIKEYGL